MLLRTSIALTASLLIVALCLIVIYVLRIGSSDVGGVPDSKLLERICKSPNFNGTEFVNLETTHSIARGNYWEALKSYFYNREGRKPSQPLPSVPVDLSALATDSSLLVCWLGHSTSLIRIDGVTVLIDPVFGDYVSLQIGRTNRFQPSPLAREDLPPIDVCVISHDHYDHLEKSTIEYLAPKGTMFLVPLGVGAHLAEWGVPADQIVDLDWWETSVIKGVEFVCTPARHLSGRALRRMNQSLWCSWVVSGPGHRLYYGGDTGPGNIFAEIGQEFGPFGLTILPIGGYSKQWPDIHLTPEQAAEAHIALRGQRLLPVHWGTFEVAPHPWDEPLSRLQEAAELTHARLLTPKLGQLVEIPQLPSP